jgi:hypothetical protein
MRRRCVVVDGLVLSGGVRLLLVVLVASPRRLENYKNLLIWKSRSHV